MRARVDEIEALLQLPLLPDRMKRANRLIVATAREAPDGRIANLAMRLMSVVHESKGREEMRGGVQAALARLRNALEETEPR
jgi:hypothetical protein